VVDKLDKHIGMLAGRQHGVVSRAQLRALGLSGSAVHDRVPDGRLYRLHRGVYAVRHPTITQEGRFMAAVLACGQGAVLSHGSAAAHWKLPWRKTPRIDVTVAGTGGRARRRLIVIHRSSLPDDEIAVKEGIAVTTPARTIIDLADISPRRALERAIDEAQYLKLDLSALRAVQGRRGSGLLRAVLAEHEPGSTRTRSPLEELFLAFCKRHDLPRPKVNTKIAGYEVDFAWTKQKVAVETDGRAAHIRAATFESDRARDLELTAAGWRPIRLTKRRLKTEAEAVASQLRRLLASP
jgi:very-short-patch-repair endonuclease